MTNINSVKLPRSKRTQWPTNITMPLLVIVAAVSAAVVVGVLAVDRHITTVSADRAAADYVRDLDLMEDNRLLLDYNRELLCVLEGKCAMRIPGIEYDMLARVTWYPAKVPGK